MSVKYNFYIEIDGVTHKVSPVYSSFKKEYVKDNDSVVLRPSFSGTLTFFGKDFQLLLPYEQSAGRCNEIPFSIERKCNNQMDKGLLLLSNGDWDLDACRVVFKIESNNPYFVLEDKGDEEINVLGVGIETVRLEFGSAPPVEHKTENKSSVNSFKYYPISYPNPDSWSLSKIEVGQGASQGSTSFPVTIEWVRQINGQKIFTFMNPATSSLEAIPDKLQANHVYNFSYLGSSNFSNISDRCIRLNDVLEYVAGQLFGLSVKSDFFQINPENISDTNYVSGKENDTNNLLLCQITDFQRPTSTERATIGIVTWEEIISDLISLFNIDFEVREGVLILEHISFFQEEGVQDIEDLTSDHRWLKGIRKYSYDNDLQYPVEEWKVSNSLFNGEIRNRLTLKDHKGVPVYYNNGCTNISREIRKKEWQISLLTPDVYSILTGPTLINSNGEILEKDPTNKDGFVILSTTKAGASSYVLNTDDGILDGYSEPNNRLSIAHLQEKYFMHGRSFRFGYMNNELKTFESSVPAKTGVPIRIPLCCDTGFSERKRVKTPLGNGVIGKSSFEYESGMLSLEIGYMTDEYETPDEQAPLAIDDEVIAKQEYPTLLDVMANDVNADGSAIEIVQNPIHGQAIVIGSKIEYTGDIGYRNDFPAGQPKDTLTYRLKRGDVYSNVAIVNIEVTGLQNPFVPGRGMDDGVLDDAYTTNAGAVLNVNANNGVLANDVFYNVNGSVKYKVNEVYTYDQTTANSGTVTMQTNGAFVYTPPAGFVGIDEFEYVAYFPGYDPSQYSLYKKAKVRILVGQPSAIHAFGEIVNRQAIDRYSTKGDLAISFYYDADKVFPRTVSNLSVRVRITKRYSRTEKDHEDKAIAVNGPASLYVFETGRVVSFSAVGSNPYSIYVGTLASPNGAYEHHENEGD